MTREDIAKVIEQLPELTSFGIGVFEKIGKDRLTPDQAKAEFRECQDELLDSAEVCSKVCDWLADKPKIKTINQRSNSYGLKHVVEKQIDESVTNGQFIAAAIHCGFKWRREEESPNSLFNIEKV
jgi:hypothetical protein